VVLRTIQHKIDFGDVSQANLWAWHVKTTHNTTKVHIHQSKQMYYNKKLKPGLVASYDIRPGERGPIMLAALHEFVTHLLT